MAVGNYWVYELVEEWVSGETVSGATRAEVTEIGLAITWTPEREFPAYLVREGPYGEWMQVSSEAVWSIASVYESDVTRFFLQPVRQYEFPLAIGERFERDQYYYGSEQCWVETLERVTVAAGVFEDCLRIRCGHFIEWLAPGVGLVKEVFEDRYATWGVGSSNKELVEYGIELSPAPYQPRPVTDTWWDLEGILFVEEVYDGDTISVEHGTFQQSSVDKVRYIGIDSPELDEPCGVEAKRANEQLLSQRGYGGLGYGELRMEKDVSDRDKYGRLLRYVYIDSPICPGGLCMVNYELVWHGWARAVEYPPDTAFADEFAEAEREARMYRRGCWGISPLPPGWE